MRKRVPVWTAMVLVLLLVLAGCGEQAAEDPQPEALRLAYNPMPFNVPLMVMKHQGFLDQQLAARGLDNVRVEYKEFDAGFNMSEAMAGGRLDIATVTGFTSAVSAKAGGRDAKVISAFSRAPAAFALVVAADKTELPADIRGWKVALPVGTEADYLLSRILEEQGLARSDVQIVNMLVPDAAAALLSGNVDAAVLVEPVLSRLEAGNQIRVYRDGTDLVLGMTVTTVWNEFLAAYPEVVKAYLAAIDDSLAYMEENPEQVMDLAVQETGLPEPVAARLMTKYDFDPVITEFSGLEDQIDFLYDSGLIGERIALEDLLDLSLR